MASWEGGHCLYGKVNEGVLNEIYGSGKWYLPELDELLLDNTPCEVGEHGLLRIGEGDLHPYGDCNPSVTAVLELEDYDGFDGCFVSSPLTDPDTGEERSFEEVLEDVYRELSDAVLFRQC